MGHALYDTKCSAPVRALWVLLLLLACDDPVAIPRRPSEARIFNVTLFQCRGDESAPEQCLLPVADTMYASTYYVARVRWENAPYLSGALLWTDDGTKPCPNPVGSQCMVFTYVGPFGGADTLEYHTLFLLSYAGVTYTLQFSLTDAPSGGRILDQWRRVLPLTAERP